VTDRWALAVDGGNTKTLAVVAGADGQIAALARGGCSDIYGAPSPGAALDEIARTVDAALAQAGLDGGAIDSAAFSLAGADWPEDFELFERELTARIGLRETPLVVNDALGGLRAGSPDWTGLAVVAGTYNAIGARAADGRVFHIGFWPDGAGGRDLGRDGIRAVYRAELGTGPETALTGLALERYGAEDALALMHAFTRRGGLDVIEQDRFASDVLDAADDGDQVARALVDGKARMAGLQARASAARLGLELEGTLVVMSGGVFGHPTTRIADGVMAQLPGAIPVRDVAPPVAGALLLALDRAGIEGDAGAIGAALLPLITGKPAARPLIAGEPPARPLGSGEPAVRP
jgi:N-acetylglucosamine kinase-like BadF-type ATPase